MRIKLIRKLDYFCGIPLCFILTLWHKIAALLKSSSKGQKEKVIRKILIMKPSELGSLILSYPLICRIKQIFPDSDIYFLTNHRNKDLFSVLNIVSESNIFTIDDRSPWTAFNSIIRFLYQIRKQHIDAVLDLEFFSRITMILSYFSGAKKRIGFYKYQQEGLYRGELLTHKIQYNPHLHVSQLFLNFVETLSLEKKAEPSLNTPQYSNNFTLPRFIPSDSQKKQLYVKLTEHQIPSEYNLFLINPGEGILPLREWPVGNFIRLVQMILSDKDNAVIIVGTERCKDKADQLINVLKSDRLIDLSGQTSIPEALTLLSVSRCLITNDSGMAHLGALTHAQQIVFFGPEHPQIFSPLGKNTHVLWLQTRCSPCLSVHNHRNSNCTDNLCLKNISPESVFHTLEDKKII